MTEDLEDHKGTVNIGDRTITNLRFANNIDGLARKEEELASLVNCREKKPIHPLEITPEKTKRRPTTQMSS